MPTDALGWFLFIIISLFFAGLITLILKWTVGRISTTINATPFSVMVLVIFAFMVILEIIGVPVDEWYRAFFRWLSTAFYIPVPVFSILPVLELIPVDNYWLSMPQLIFIYLVGLVTGIILAYALMRRRRKR